MGVIADTVIDLVGAVGGYVLAGLLPARRLRVSPRIVKRAISKYQARGPQHRPNHLQGHQHQHPRPRRLLATHLNRSLHGLATRLETSHFNVRSQRRRDHPSGRGVSHSSADLEALIMDANRVLEALEAGEFDGVSHTYQPYDGYGNQTHQVAMSVSSGTIEVSKTTSGKFFDGKENTRYSETSTDYLTGMDAVDFIAQRPYYFSQVRPDLF